MKSCQGHLSVVIKDRGVSLFSVYHSYLILLLFSLYFQYIHPSDSHKLGQAELVCIDEAAAIPLPLVKNLIGPYLIFMSSTVNG